jgi:ABC-type phosphate transport system substrate-binding protein
MTLRRTAAVLVFLLAFLTPCFAHHMAVIVNKENKTDDIMALYLAKIFRAQEKKWPDGTVIVVVLHKNSPGETETLQRLLNLSSSGLKALIAAHKDTIQLGDSDAEVLKLVESMPGALGLVDVRAVNNSINVVRVDGKLPMEDGYLPH